MSMERVIKELILNSYRELNGCYQERRIAEAAFNKAAAKPQGPMNILNLLVGKSDQEVPAPVREKLNNSFKKIDDFWLDFESSVKDIVFRLNPELRSDIADLSKKIGFFKNEVQVNDALKLEIKDLKTEVAAFLDFKGFDASPADLLSAAKTLAAKIDDQSKGPEFDPNGDLESVRQYLINASRTVGGRIFKINQVLSVYEPKLHELDKQVSGVLHEATTELNERARSYKPAELAYGM
jgi:hypothetical protein